MPSLVQVRSRRSHGLVVLLVWFLALTWGLANACSVDGHGAHAGLGVAHGMVLSEPPLPDAAVRAGAQMRLPALPDPAPAFCHDVLQRAAPPMSLQAAPRVVLPAGWIAAAAPVYPTSLLAVPGRQQVLPEPASRVPIRVRFSRLVL